MRREARLAIAIAVLASVLIPFFLGSSTTSVVGTHEPTHRYFIAGRVIHEDGSPACGVTILALGASGDTDLRGEYRFLLHLHHPDSGEGNDIGTPITVQVEGTSLSQETTAQPSTTDDGWGESRFDFTVPIGFGGDCTNPLLQTALYVGLPVGGIAAAVVAYIKVLRPWAASRRASPSLAQLSGIGKGREGELRSAGIRDLDGLASADPGYIAQKTSIGRKEARRLVKRAQEALDQR